MNFLTIALPFAIFALDFILIYGLFRYFMFCVQRGIDEMEDIEYEFCSDGFAENERIGQSKQIEWFLSR